MSCIPTICISRGQIPIHAGPGVISRYVSVLRHRNGTRASQYLSLMSLRACWNSSGFRNRTFAENSGPVTFPRMVEGAILTSGLLRSRLALPVLLAVMTYRCPFSSPNQTGVYTGVPFLRKVARLIYRWPLISGGIVRAIPIF